MEMLKRAIKRVAERMLIRMGVAEIARRGSRGRTVVLAYHNVVPDNLKPSGDLSLHLPRRDFARQLDLLAESHYVAPISALASPANADRPVVVITFDDAYAGALTAGVEELVKRGMPATIFVAPDLLGTVPWWDILARQNGGAIPDALRREALGHRQGRRGSILANVTTVDAANLAVARIGTESELTSAASRPGITLGSHSWSHPNLSSLEGTTLDAELTRPREWLTARFSMVVPWLSYPYGLFNPSVQRAAERAGYSGALRIDGGWIPRPCLLPFAMPRMNVPSGLSLDGFRLRVAGV
jgi:peptidoglycan/xylan/chitin deacetylase (PgdA/CDA1 family)